MARMSDKLVRETDGRMLRLLAGACAADGAWSQVSLRDAAGELGLSVARARGACGRLERDGLVVREPRYAPDGGQLANAFRLSETGWAAALADEARSA